MQLSPTDTAPHPQAPAAGADDRMRLAWLLLVGGLIGLAASFVLTVEKIALLRDPGYVPSCSINPVLSCGSVMQRTQAEVFGLPNSLLGVVGFSVVAATGAALLGGARLARWYWLGLQAGVTAGAVFVHWLIFQSLYRIGALCPYCMVDRYIAENPGLSRVLDAAGFFDVFAAPWFAATYLLLFISLLGCVIPRLRLHARAMLAPPPVVPRRLERLPQSASYEADGAPAAVAAEAIRRLSGWRTVTREEPDGAVTVAAERGYLRETGNLLFHGALVVLLAGIAAGKFWGYQGTVLLEEGKPGICNASALYDAFRPGRLIDDAALPPFCIQQVQDFTATYEPDGTPAEFRADITYTLGEDGAPQQYALKVNKPLRVDGTRIYLVGHGFSPRFTVRTPDGTVVTDASAPFVPQDGALLSEGAVKLLDEVRPQLALFGTFAPLAVDWGDGVMRSASSQPVSPGVAIVVYRGNLGLDSGRPQSVYNIDQQQVQRGALKEVATARLTPGRSVTLDDGTTITFDGYREWATIQVNSDPGQLAVLVASAAMLIGLLLSLTVHRRRLFLRITPTAGGGSEVLVGGLARSDTGNFTAQFTRLAHRLQQHDRTPG